MPLLAMDQDEAVASYIDRAWDEAVRMGARNQEVVELARRHCLNMEFVPSSGRGMAEQATGLPIDMRQIRCSVALGSMASNLDLIVDDFYREHCIGCSLRRPTGEVPNLATRVEDAAAAAAAAEQQERADLAARREQRRLRADERRALGAGLGEAMAGVLRDIDVLDEDPAAPASREDQDAARARASALADRAPELFADSVVAVAVALVEDGHSPELLDPLRRLAAGRPEYAADIARAAIEALRTGPSPWAGPCLADLVGSVPAGALDDAVCRSLVWLAGAPALDAFGRSRPGRANDPTGLQAAAAVAPATAERVLDAMLPPAHAPTSLVVPADAAPAPPAVPARERAAAAGAVRALTATAPGLAAGLVHALVRDLAVPPDDPYNDPAAPAIERTLAFMLVVGVGDVATELDAAAQAAGGEHRERLMHVLSVAAEMISGDERHREPGDPVPDDARRVAVADALAALAAARLGGDWGDNARFAAAKLLEGLAKDDPAGTLPRLPVLLGAVLGLLEARKAPPVSTLDVLAGQPSAEDLFDRMNRENAIDSAVGRVLTVVEGVAEAGAATVCAALEALVADERGTDRGSNLLWRLLPVLGRIGRRHGHEPGVLRTVLPVLHSYLLDGDASLRARAIDAWAEIGETHALPSSLSDLLPALAGDRVILVCRSVARAAARLDWPVSVKPALLEHALQLMVGVDPAEHPDAVKDAVRAAVALAGEMDSQALLEAVEAKAIEVTDRLDGYDLRDVLRREWLPQTTRSSGMAELRLRQAIDPQINDRWNARDDAEMTALLACGPGLSSLPDDALNRAALDQAPEHPLAAAEFAEVASRAARPGSAAAVMSVCLDATPDQPAYAGHRQLLGLVRAASEADADAAAGRDWRPAAARAAAAAAMLSTGDESDERRRLTGFADASAEVRRLLAGDGQHADADPAVAARGRGDSLDAAGQALATASQTATDTGAYLRAVAAACPVAAHLLRAEAVALDADIDRVRAHAEAATRRAQAVASQLDDQFADGDPLAAPLRARLSAAADREPGAPVSALLAEWAALSMPMPVVRGPRRRSRQPATAAAAAAASGSPPVAVLLASLDGRLVTGPEVLRCDRVYDLRADVQTGAWPDWANRLDLELVTHLTASEITAPEITWGRDDHAGDGETYTKSGSLVLRFGLGPGQPAPPLRARLTWRGTRDDQPAWPAVDVSGHRELRLRPYDATRDRATDHPVFDERLLGMYDRLARAGYEDDQLQAFCRLLTSVCRAGLRMTWDKRYRRGTRVTERKFHDDLHAALTADAELEGRVDRGSPLALGYLDVRHDGITAELKVERRTPVTQESAPKYMGQPTQYAAADGARLSILAILDMSPKALPVGTPENYLFTLEPRLHGLDNPEAPSLVAVLVVNGNMPTPSRWSGRKPAEPPRTR